MKLFMIIFYLIAAAKASYSHMYFKDEIDHWENIVIAKIISLKAEGTEFTEAKIKVLEVLKGKANNELVFKPGTSWVYGHKSIQNGEKSIFLFDDGRSKHTIKHVIRINSFKEDGVQKAQLVYGINYPVRMQKDISKNDSLTKSVLLRCKGDTNQIYHDVATFDTLVATIKSLILEPPLIKGHRFIGWNGLFSPNRYEIDEFIKSQKNINLIDSLALFDNKYLPGLKESVIKFQFGDPKKEIQNSEIKTLIYSNYIKKEIRIKNGNLISISELNSQSVHVKEK